MNKLILFAFLIFISFSLCFSQIPVEKYREEIQNLKTEKQIDDYWNRLEKIDQEMLVFMNDIHESDSLSISNMIRTALIFEIHGNQAYDQNNVVPILNLSHNWVNESQIAFWPIIEKCREVGGVIESFGGKYPAYELESISLSFYDYSLVGQESKYPSLMKKLKEHESDYIVDSLIKSFNNLERLKELSEINILHNWKRQSFKGTTGAGIFSFVTMSDNEVYLKRNGRIEKLILIETGINEKIFRLVNEPFGWTYVYGSEGSLSLVDEQRNILIEYTLSK
ncbi:hypothetical protein AAU57_02815 [Nonlabens sp. YIK11]|uniref:hypothetical protein n=1 Tax=Nonlabens sp. YIK11 TaxID=1453349 RepID=UPI0006DC67DF|nr:hypothetical protein [Nonlabens sp. YIK11]KQC32380.1 hypothetical protein AAU57_02815 [Nonlabens sp. YIK11]